jgi:hypothetical protein
LRKFLLSGGKAKAAAGADDLRRLRALAVGRGKTPPVEVAGSGGCREMSNRGSRYLRVLLVQAAWSCWSSSGQSIGNAMGSNPGSRRRSAPGRCGCGRADWREVARIVLHIDPDREPVRARRAFESHLAQKRADPIGKPGLSAVPATRKSPNNPHPCHYHLIAHHL